MDKDTHIVVGNVGDLTSYWLLKSDVPYSMYQYPVLYQWEDHVVRWCDEYRDDAIIFCRHNKATDICTQPSTRRRFDKRRNIWICQMYE